MKLRKRLPLQLFYLDLAILLIDKLIVFLYRRSRMKKIFLLIAILGISVAGFAQQKEVDSLLPYQKNPTLPAFHILMMDSSTIFNTYYIPEGKPTVLMLFSPDCDHCQHLTEMLLKGMDSLKQIQFYLVTPMNLTMLKGFYDKYHLADYKNIKVGKDYEYFFYNFYGAHYVPYIAVYDKQKKLLKTFEGSTTVKDLYELTNKK